MGGKARGVFVPFPSQARPATARHGKPEGKGLAGRIAALPLAAAALYSARRLALPSRQLLAVNVPWPSS